MRIFSKHLALHLLTLNIFCSACWFGGGKRVITEGGDENGEGEEAEEEVVVVTPITVIAPNILYRPHDPTPIGYGSITFSAGDSATTSFQCKIDNGAYSACTSPYTFEDLTRGGHAFFVKGLAVDGTESGAASVAWRIDQTFTSQVTDDSFSGQQDVIRHVFVDEDGKIFASTSEGPRLSTDGGASFTDLMTVSSTYRSYKMLKDSAGRLFSANKDGLAVSTNNGTSWTWYQAGTGLPAAANNTVSDIWIDAADRIWVVSTGGLSLATGSDALTFSTKLSAIIGVMAFDELTGKIYVDDATAGFIKWSANDGSTWTNLISDSGVSAIAVDGTNIYLGTTGGLKISNDSGTTWATKTTAHGLADNFVTKVVVNTSGLILAGSTEGLSISMDQGASFRIVNTQNGLGGEYVYSIFYDFFNQIWVSHTNGFLSHSNEWGTLSELPSDLVAPTISGTPVAGTIKAMSQPLSWTKASDLVSSAANIKYSVYASTTNNISTVADAYLNGVPSDLLVSGTVRSGWVSDIGGASLKLPANLNYYVTVIAMDAAGNKTAYPSIAYNVPEISWTTITSSGLNGGLWETGALYFANKMWLFGGVDATIAVINDGISSANGSTWTNEALGNNSLERFSHGAIVYDDKMYLLGGQIGNLNHSADVLSSVDGSNWTLETAAPGWQQRKSFQPAVFKDKIFVVGGSGVTGGASGGSATYFNDVWNYDGSSWSQSTSNGSFGVRHTHATIVYGNKIWIFGGHKDNTYLAYQDVWNSDDGANWTQVATTHPLGSISDSRPFILNGELCLFGGESAVETWVVTTRCTTDGVSWRTISSDAPNRLNGYGFFQKEDAIYVVGGSNYTTYPTTIQKGE